MNISSSCQNTANIAFARLPGPDGATRVYSNGQTLGSLLFSNAEDNFLGWPAAQSPFEVSGPKLPRLYADGESPAGVLEDIVENSTIRVHEANGSITLYSQAGQGANFVNNVFNTFDIAKMK